MQLEFVEAVVMDDTDMLRVEGLCKSFGTQKVLRNVNFSVKKGKTVVVLGPSGSGKSTLLRCINLLEPIDRGSIYLGGVEIASRRRDAHLVRREIAMVFQNFELFQHLTAAENIMLAPVRVKGLPKADARRLALALLERVHIPSKADAYPDELSGGQQQRVAIARALAMDPKVILYDEPTSALDPEMIKEVLEVMVELSNSGMTSVVVSHEMGFARSAADHVIFMDNGELIEDGAPDQFFTRAVHPRARRFLDQIIH
jgi:polar amino acid transport system ATP-binding protein